jgi:hypothetical protein
MGTCGTSLGVLPRLPGTDPLVVLFKTAKFYSIGIARTHLSLQRLPFRLGEGPIESVWNLALELAMLGNKGLNINDPTKKYRIRGWSGEFTGLHLISIMYAAFQQFAPDTDIGIDLSKEYRIAMDKRNHQL